MTVAISKALEEGAATVVCASTGNTAASAAAYAARAGLVAVVLQPERAVATSKIAQARAVGARVLEVRGSFDAGLDAARALAERGTHVLVNSLNPHRVEGQKTAAFEIVEELGGAPDLSRAAVRRRREHVRVRARLRGGRRRHAADRRRRGAAARDDACVGDPDRAAGPCRGGDRGDPRVGRRRRDARGRRDPRCVERARAHEGLFCEPASAAGFAALAHVEVEPGCRVVCVLTGHGLKDPAPVADSGPPPIVRRPRSGRDRRGVAVTVLARVRAPASTANLGPGFDCAAAALDLWNELEVREGDGEVDLNHLGVRAFARSRRPTGSSSPSRTRSRASAASARAPR